MKNLLECPIRVSISNNTEPAVFVKHAHNGSFHISGRDINLLKVLSDKLNFRVNFSDIRDYGNVFENGTANGPLKALIDGYADISISD